MTAVTAGRSPAVPPADDPRARDPGIRQQLAATVVSAAGPYGYTISPGGSTALSDRPPSIWGNAHVPAAGVALTLVWLLVSALHGPLVWAAVGYLATLAYFLRTVLQRQAVRRLASRQDTDDAEPTRRGPA